MTYTHLTKTFIINRYKFLEGLGYNKDEIKDNNLYMNKQDGKEFTEEEKNLIKITLSKPNI